MLVAGLRSLGISDNGHGVWTSTDKLSNEWLSKLLDMDVAWAQADENLYEATDRASGKKAGTATRVDLVFGPIRNCGQLPSFMLRTIMPANSWRISSPHGPRS